MTDALRDDVVADPVQLRRTLNDSLLTADERSANAARGEWVLVDVNLTTGATVAVNTAPFPQDVQLPVDFTARGVSIERVQNNTTTTVPSTAIGMPYWHPTGNGITLDFIPGLAVSTAYVLTLRVSRYA